MLHRPNAPGRTAGVVVAVIIILGSPPTLLGQTPLGELIRAVQPAVVTIHTFDGDDAPAGGGTGFFLGDTGDVITNYHVLRGRSRAEIRTHDGRHYVVRNILAADEDRDLIRVSVNLGGDQVNGLSLTRELPDVGDRILVVGSPLGLEQTVSDGIVSAIRDIPSIGQLLQLTAPVSPGSSGSPVVDSQGAVIGIVTSQMRHGQNLNFAVPARYLDHLDDVGGQPMRSWAYQHHSPAPAQRTDPDPPAAPRSPETREDAQPDRAGVGSGASPEGRFGVEVGGGWALSFAEGELFNGPALMITATLGLTRNLSGYAGLLHVSHGSRRGQDVAVIDGQPVYIESDIEAESQSVRLGARLTRAGGFAPWVSVGGTYTIQGGRVVDSIYPIVDNQVIPQIIGERTRDRPSRGKPGVELAIGMHVLNISGVSLAPSVRVATTGYGPRADGEENLRFVVAQGAINLRFGR